jgi:hypothetical protein
VGLNFNGVFFFEETENISVRKFIEKAFEDAKMENNEKI